MLETGSEDVGCRTCRGSTPYYKDHWCYECTANSHCASNDTKKVCASEGYCVECEKDSDCKSKEDLDALTVKYDSLLIINEAGKKVYPDDLRVKVRDKFNKISGK